MNKATAGFMKGIGTGMAVGIATGVAGAVMVNSNKKMLKKKAGKAVKAVTGMIEDVSNMMK